MPPTYTYRYRLWEDRRALLSTFLARALTLAVVVPVEVGLGPRRHRRMWRQRDPGLFVPTVT